MQNNDPVPFFPSQPDLFELTGRLDGETSRAIIEDALLCIESGARRMILDCSALSYVTGAGLRAFIELARAMREVNGSLIACNLQPQVAKMVQATGLERFMPTYANQVDAIEALEG